VPSLFTRIIDGELPGRFVWKDELAVAFLTINPISPGHALVVPREEVDHWVDMSPELNAHVMEVARSVSRAIAHGFPCTKVGVMIAGLEVPHTHVHLFPIDSLGQMSFDQADPDPDPAAMDAAAETLRASLRALGYAQASE